MIFNVEKVNLEPYLKNDDFVVENYNSLWSGVQVNAQGNKATDTVTLQKAGYYPIGIAGFNNSSSYVAISGIHFTNRQVSSCSVVCRLANVSSSARTTNVSLSVLWMKVKS